MFHKEKLQNKSTLITIPVKGTEAVTVLMMFPVGSRYENAEQNGLSHFIEHMLFKGTLSRPTTLDISKELDKVGAEYNAYTSRDHTGYYIKAAADKIELALDLLSDMVWNSKFNETELEKEKGVIVEELNMYKDNPTMYIEQLFEETLYHGHPLGRDIGGTAKTVRAVSRAQMVSYYKDFYQPANMILAVAGKIDGQTAKLVKKYFFKNGAVPSGSRFEKFLCKEKSCPRAKVFFKETDQTHLVLGFPAVNYESSISPAVSLLNIILGGTMSSRLFVEVREKRGLAYMIHSGVNQYQDVGNFFIRAGLDKTRLAEALKIIILELRKIKKDGVTAEELKMAKDNVAGRFVLQLEDSSVQAEWYAKQALLMKRTRTPEEELQRYKKVTAGEVKKAALKIFDIKKMRVAAIGAFKNSKEIVKMAWLADRDTGY